MRDPYLFPGEDVLRNKLDIHDQKLLDEAGREINRALFESNARYVRTALVAYNAFFADGNDFSKKEYLRRIVYDSFIGK